MTDFKSILYMCLLWILLVAGSTVIGKGIGSFISLFVG